MATEWTEVNKALGALHCTENVHGSWFGAYPRGYIDKVFMRKWQELNHLGNAYGATFKELKIKGPVCSVLKRTELDSNQPYPEVLRSGEKVFISRL